MKDVWARIAAWLRVHAPDELDALRPPASNRWLNHLEDAIGLQIPFEMEQSYKVHDGFWLSMYRYGGVLSSLQAIESDWKQWQEVSKEGWFEEMKSEPEGPIKPVHWNLKWLPVTDAGSGNCFCVDLDPASGGTVGQIIWFSHESGPERVVANGFADWLEQYAANLESGRFVYHPLDGIVDSREPE